MLNDLLDAAIVARAPLMDPEHQTAFRLFNGFSEGLPTLALDVYQRALVIHDYSETADEGLTKEALELCRAKLPWLTSAVLKFREGHAAERNGTIVFGEKKDLPYKVLENGVWYAINLTLNRDASFYLDTRNLRVWAKENLAGKKVLNTFAYTGSLGVAARAAPAETVLTTDANRDFLAVAERSFATNQFVMRKKDFLPGDFFEIMSRFKSQEALFDCVFLDPPVFSKTEKGTVNLTSGMVGLINKVRPLVGDGGALVLVNNAVFVSGADFKAQLDSLCENGYLQIEKFIDVPEDYCGYTKVGKPPADPAPFNHSTKIAVLRAKRKDGRRATP